MPGIENEKSKGNYKRLLLLLCETSILKYNKNCFNKANIFFHIGFLAFTKPVAYFNFPTFVIEII